MKWFAVQSVFRHGVASRKKAIYEERIVLYRARTANQALSRARKDAKAYLKSNPQFEQLAQTSVFELGTENAALDGAEAWSCLYQGDHRPERFWQARYEKFSIFDP